MKKVFLGLTLIALLTACGGNPGDLTTSENPEEPTSSEDVKPEPGSDDYLIPIKHMQDTPILHCFNWSMETIEANLAEIKAAGFKTVQLSPMQPQKDYETGSWSGRWWKLYQPLGFSVSSQNNHNVLGTKTQLTSLCAKAKSMGIDVIMDVVSNHLAGGSSMSFNSNISAFEPEIYSKELLHKLGRGVDDNDTEALLKGYLGGYPDIQTENTIVQQRVLHLLREYLDCGVNGFRFDAAKHIETPEDGVYSSNFWPTILNGATQYAQEQGYQTPYYYGEILYTVGKNRSINQYTKYMSVTDTNYSTDVLNSVKSGSTASLKPNYLTSSDKTVLWAESHDTYSNDGHETTYVSTEDINKAYVIDTSRQNVSTLYLSRPQGNMGDKGDTAYLSKSVKAINSFHAYCVDLEDNISTNSGYFINQRGKYGLAVVNVNGSSSATIDVPNLEDGIYVNLATGSGVTISDHKVNISFTDNACILVHQKIYNAGQATPPTLSIESYQEVYSGSQTINLNVVGADKVIYNISGSDEQEASDNKIVLPSSLSDGIIDLRITASNKYGNESMELRLIKTTALVNKPLIIIDADASVSNLAWAWGGSNPNQWFNSTVEGEIIGLDIGNNTSFLIGQFDLGITASTANWEIIRSKGKDTVFNKRIYEYSELF